MSANVDSSSRIQLALGVSSVRSASIFAGEIRAETPEANQPVGPIEAVSIVFNGDGGR
jgi:hypothetical protein